LYTVNNPFTKEETDICTVYYEDDPLEKTYFGKPIQKFKSYVLRIEFDGFRRYIDVRAYKHKIGVQKWHFVCNWCKKEVKKVYLPSFGDEFKCRKCHNLTYEETQSHDKRYDFKNINDTFKKLEDRVERSKNESQYLSNCVRIYNATLNLQMIFYDMLYFNKKKNKKY
jgi:hypothetical protein